MELYTYNKNVVYLEGESFYILFTKNIINDIKPKKLHRFDNKNFLNDRLKLAHTIHSFVPTDILCKFLKENYDMKKDECEAFDNFLGLLSNNVQDKEKPKIKIGIKDVKYINETLDYLNTTLIFKELIISFLDINNNSYSNKQGIKNYLNFVRNYEEPEYNYSIHLRDNVKISLVKDSKFNILAIHKKMFADNYILNNNGRMLIENIKILKESKYDKKPFHIQYNFLVREIRKLLEQQTVKFKVEDEICFDIEYRTTTNLTVFDLTNILFPIIRKSFNITPKQIKRININIIKTKYINNLNIKFNEIIEQD